MAFQFGIQNHSKGDAAGSYRLASRVSETSINPGETLKIEQYITGYGPVNLFKIQGYISDEVFDPSSSYVFHSPIGTLNADKTTDFKWGAQKSPITGQNFQMMMGALDVDGTQHQFMFDTGPDRTHIFTEVPAGGRAPFEYQLKTKRSARPGAHYISFYTTFNDGYNWVCQEEKVHFKINNKFEQYSTPLSILAALALIVTIIHDGFWPIGEWAYDHINNLINTCRF